MEDMVTAIEANDIHPVVDKEVFDFAKAKDAYEYMVRIFSYELSFSVYMANFFLIVGPETLWQGGY